jgi:hypothetical protein
MRDDFRKALAETQPAPLTNRSKFIKSFIYGEFGVGKTVLACSFVQTRGLLISNDTGTDSLYNHPELLARVDVVPYAGLSHLTAVAQAIEEKLEGYEKYDTVIIDTISQVQEEYLDFLIENYSFSGNQRTVANPRSPKLKLATEEIVGFPDYRLVRDKMRGPVKALIKSPVDVHFLAHLREPSMMEQQKGVITRRPNMTEQVFKLIARETSMLGLMERKGTKRTIKFETDPKTISKSRIAELDDKTVNADELPQILKKWKSN